MATFAGFPAAGAGIKLLTPAQQIVIYPEGASQTFSVRDFVQLSSGLVQRLPAPSGIAGTPILGKPLRAASGTQFTDIPVVVANGDTLFSLPVTSDGGSANLAVGQLGTTYGIWGTATDYGYNVNDTSNLRCVVVEFVGNEEWVVPGSNGAAWNVSGEAFGHAFVRIITAARQLG